MPRPLALATLALVGLTACASCQKSGGAHGEDETPEMTTTTPDQAKLPKVHLTGADGKVHTVTVEVVRTGKELERGLMYRRHLDPDAGMLFLMGEEKVQTFWMKNTYLPLDMIFIQKDMVVAGVYENAPPQTLDLRYVDKPSSYVLEVNAFWAREHGIGAGAKVRYENVRE
jgi:uncharacterized membrane protein (UPF0127 family)